MLGAPRLPSNTEITSLKGSEKRHATALFTWRCLTCHSCQGGQYTSWYGARGAAEIHRKVHHSGG